MPHHHSTLLKKTIIALNLAMILLLWGDLLGVLSTEWAVNEQYRFGYLVPFVCFYLIFLRWVDRPATQTCGYRRFALTLIYASVLFIFPLKIVFESNPDWRLVYWLQAFVVYGATLSTIWYWGGFAWAKHFAFALALMLFAVPWPVRMELPLTLQLMHMVAAVTVETLNLLGIHAIQKGNLIELANGIVGVEEACSGVRSFQSTLMSAFFLGELFLFGGTVRIILIMLGAAVSIILNIGRTFGLTFIVHRDGVEFMKEIHDPIGYLVSFLAFLLLLLAAWFVSRKRSNRAEPPITLGKASRIRWLSPSSVLPLTLLYFLSIVLVEVWYDRKGKPDPNPIIGTIDWETANPKVSFRDIPGPVRAMLRYSEGTRATWSTSDTEEWIVFYLVWKPGDVSSFIDVHRPELCLSGAGFSLSDQGEPIVWIRDGLELQLTPYRFESSGQPVYVFFAVWNDNQDESIFSTVRSARDRLLAAYRGELIKGRRSLEIVILGLSSMSQAQKKAIAFLDKAMVVTRN